jgi:hypothetical protein
VPKFIDPVFAKLFSRKLEIYKFSHRSLFPSENQELYESGFYSPCTLIKRIGKYLLQLKNQEKDQSLLKLKGKERAENQELYESDH